MMPGRHWRGRVGARGLQVSLSNLALTVPQLEVACVLLKHDFICERLLVTGNDLPPEAGYFLAEMLKVGASTCTSNLPYWLKLGLQFHFQVLSLHHHVLRRQCKVLLLAVGHDVVT